MSAMSISGLSVSSMNTWAMVVGRGVQLVAHIIEQTVVFYQVAISCPRDGDFVGQPQQIEEVR